MSTWPAVAAAEQRGWITKVAVRAKLAPEDAVAYYGRMVDEGRAIYAARLALGDFEPRREQTFWQWVCGRKP